MAGGSLDLVSRLINGLDGVLSKATKDDNRDTNPYDKAVCSNSPSMLSLLRLFEFCAILARSKFAIFSRAQTLAIPTWWAAWPSGTLTDQARLPIFPSRVAEPVACLPFIAIDT